MKTMTNEELKTWLGGDQRKFQPSDVVDELVRRELARSAPADAANVEDVETDLQRLTHSVKDAIALAASFAARAREDVAERNAVIKGLNGTIRDLSERIEDAAVASEVRAETKELLQKCADVIDDDLEERPRRHALGRLLASVRCVLKGVAPPPAPTPKPSTGEGKTVGEEIAETWFSSNSTWNERQRFELLAKEIDAALAARPQRWIEVSDDEICNFVRVRNEDRYTSVFSEKLLRQFINELNARPGVTAGEPKVGDVVTFGSRPAITLIGVERDRQVKSFGIEHDDEHDEDELARAASCYALPKDSRKLTCSGDPELWPWDDGWDPKPDDRIRELVKAGALIVAEIERLQRLARLDAAKNGGAR